MPPHRGRHRVQRFNEAGAINAGKRFPTPMFGGKFLVSMRPAQLTPENASFDQGSGRMPDGFNEAGAINAGKRGVTLANIKADMDVSMRPAQLTPENLSPFPSDRPRQRRFNEAGAINAGKRHGGLRVPQMDRLVSMRPAQLTPENEKATNGELGRFTFQ